MVNPYSFTGNFSRNLLRVKDHVVQLARDHALDELGKSHADLVGSDGLRAQQTRQKNTRLIFRTCPGRSCNIGAVQNKNGEVVVEPSAMAATLREHWATIFSASKVNTDLLHRWLEEDFNLKEVNEKAPFQDGALMFKKSTFFRPSRIPTSPHQVQTAYLFWPGVARVACRLRFFTTLCF